MSDERGAPARWTLALPFTVLTEPGVVRLIAGEDLRFTFRAEGIESWLPALVERARAGSTREAALRAGPSEARDRAGALFDRLVEERILAPAADLAPTWRAGEPAAEMSEARVLSLMAEPSGRESRSDDEEYPRYFEEERRRVAVRGPARRIISLADDIGSAEEVRVVLSGEGGLAATVTEALTAADIEVALGASASPGAIHVLCQSTLDYAGAREFGRAALAGGARGWLWVSEAPLARAYVGPVFLPDGGPCMGCLGACFRRLSPAPELYDALDAHAEAGGRFEPTPLPAAWRRLLGSLVALKVAGLREALPPASTFELSVLELARLEVSGHPLSVDVDCPDHG